MDQNPYPMESRKYPRLTKKELHYLIDEHQQKDPRHALQEMDGWAINYPGGDIWQHTYYLIHIMGNPKTTKKEWKEAYRAHRYNENNQDPGGCFGNYE